MHIYIRELILKPRGWTVFLSKLQRGLHFKFYSKKSAEQPSSSSTNRRKIFSKTLISFAQVWSVSVFMNSCQRFSRQPCFAGWIWASLNVNAIIQVLLHFLSLPAEIPECTAQTGEHACKNIRAHVYSYTAVKPTFVSLSILPFLDCLIATCFLSCQPLLQREGRCLWRTHREARDEKRGGTGKKKERWSKEAKRDKSKEREVRERETWRLRGWTRKVSGQGKQGDKGRVIGSYAADIPVSLSSVPGENTIWILRLYLILWLLRSLINAAHFHHVTEHNMIPILVLALSGNHIDIIKSQ